MLGEFGLVVLQTEGAAKNKGKIFENVYVPQEVVELYRSQLFSVFFFLLVLQCLQNECLWRVS